MSNNEGQYRYIEPVVHAERFFSWKRPWPKGVTSEYLGDHRVRTAVEGDVPVIPGDWIVTDSGGRLSLYRNQLFREVFAPVESMPVRAETAERPVYFQILVEANERLQARIVELEKELALARSNMHTFTIDAYRDGQTVQTVGYIKGWQADEQA